jgi:hypothetical protein
MPGDAAELAAELGGSKELKVEGPYTQLKKRDTKYAGEDVKGMSTLAREVDHWFLTAQLTVEYPPPNLLGSQVKQLKATIWKGLTPQPRFSNYMPYWSHNNLPGL